MRDLRSCVGPADRVMVVAPHPDDETLATGGALQWAARVGADIRVVFMTDGENNPWAQRATEGHWCITRPDQRRWGARRRREALDALVCLGVAPECARFLGFPDQHITESLTADPAAAILPLLDEIDTWRPSVLFVPALDDHHPDHGATAVMAHLALARCAHRPRVLHYWIHPPSAEGPGEGTSFVVLSRGEREAKRRALLRHVSQLKLRRGFMLGFTESPERFGEDDHASRARASTQPLRLLHSIPGELVFGIGRSLRILLGGVALLLVTLADDEASVLRVELEQRGARAVRSGVGSPDVDSTITTVRSGQGFRITVAAPRLRAADRCLVKLDASRDRNMGFFDPWPWLDVRRGARTDRGTPPP